LKNEKKWTESIALVRSEENDLKTYFLSNISHELRTPNAIVNLTDSISSEVERDIKKNAKLSNTRHIVY
jgi:signal transduction histidine kinase